MEQKDSKIFNNNTIQSVTEYCKLNDIENNPSKTIVDNDFLMQIKNKLYIV